MGNTENFICLTIEQILNRQHLISHLFYNNVKDLPSDASGIYFLWSKRKRLVYIGQSGNIRARLHSNHIYNGTQLISFILVGNKDNRLEIEKGLIFALRPPANDWAPAHYGTGARYNKLINCLEYRRYTQLRFIK